MLGAILCQILSAAVLIASASSLSAHHHDTGLDNIAEIGEAFGTLIGPTWGRAVFAIGLSGGALVATIVVCLSAAWAMGEAMGVRHSLEQHPLDAPCVLLLLFMLARRALPDEHRLKGVYALLVGTGLGLTAALGLYAGIIGSLG